jgi:hypothetical protein
MADLSDDSLVETLRLYRETLEAIRELYIESGKLLRGSSAGFPVAMTPMPRRSPNRWTNSIKGW